jgi:hypothetical protein
MTNGAKIESLALDSRKGISRPFKSPLPVQPRFYSPGDLQHNFRRINKFSPLFEKKYPLFAKLGPVSDRLSLTPDCFLARTHPPNTRPCAFHLGGWPLSGVCVKRSGLPRFMSLYRKQCCRNRIDVDTQIATAVLKRGGLRMGADVHKFAVIDC